MRPDVYQFMKEQIIALRCDDGLVLDIGSRDINGSLRGLFGEATYIGLDLETGRNVTVVHDAHDLPFGTIFDCVVCADMLEHDTDPFTTVREVFRVLKSGCHFIVTAAGNGFHHHYPPDYWRFTLEGFQFLLSRAGFDVIHAEIKNQEVFAVGKKPAGDRDEPEH